MTTLMLEFSYIQSHEPNSSPDCRRRASLVMNLAFGSRELRGVTKLTTTAKTSSTIVCSSVCKDRLGWVGLVVGWLMLLLMSSGSLQARQPGYERDCTECIERWRLCSEEQLIFVHG
jgi:hypothetical protein